MCGRTACTLRQEQLRKATSYRPSKHSGAGGGGGSGGGGKFKKTRWVDSPAGKSYRPSTNLAPTDTIPVLVGGAQAGCADEEERVLLPMRWGLIPHFHRGELSQMKLSTFNARSEEFAEKAMFSRPFKRGQRCAVVCDGYYEWKRDGASRKPYFLYVDKDADWAQCGKHNSGDGDDDDCWSEEAGWQGRKLTVMAGIFEQWRSSDGDQPLHSFTILTQPASSRLSWLHHRQPVFLESEDAIRGWISDADPAAARALITAGDSVSWHIISPDINNTSNKSASFAPVKSSKEAGFMSAWLKKGGKHGEEAVEKSHCEDGKVPEADADGNAECEDENGTEKESASEKAVGEKWATEHDDGEEAVGEKRATEHGDGVEASAKRSKQ